MTAPPDSSVSFDFQPNFVPGHLSHRRFLLARGPPAHIVITIRSDLFVSDANSEICLSRPLSDLSVAPLPKSQGPGVCISLFGNSRLNPLTLAGSATGALLRAPNSVHGAQVMNRAGLRTSKVSADAYLVSNFS